MASWITGAMPSGAGVEAIVERVVIYENRVGGASVRGLAGIGITVNGETVMLMLRV